jgi:DMSO/TMAO reductase YedYZ heme-binding membrane subunit
VLHFYWLVKADVRRPFQYGAVLALLLGYRLLSKWIPLIASRFSRRTSAIRARKDQPA